MTPSSDRKASISTARSPNTSNSIATKFSVLRAVYNKAVRHKVFAETENPFKQYNVGRFWKPTRKRANLKRIAEMAGLKVNLTTYVARHTFATVLKRSGVNIAIISESLGHSDLETTQIYLDSFENSQIDEAMKNLL